MATTLEWPAGVTQDFELGSYAERPESNVVEFAPEVGPPMRRRRSSIASALLSFNAILDHAELESLLAWHRDVIQDGALSFMRKHPRAGDYREFELTEPPAAAEISPRKYRVKIALRALP